jgi:hypothetical protein
MEVPQVQEECHTQKMICSTSKGTQEIKRRMKIYFLALTQVLPTSNRKCIYSVQPEQAQG